MVKEVTMAEKKLEIGVIGLGKFGLRMASTLVSLGHTVLGIDMSEARVQRAEEALDSVYKADAKIMSPACVPTMTCFGAIPAPVASMTTKSSVFI